MSVFFFAGDWGVCRGRRAVGGEGDGGGKEPEGVCGLGAAQLSSSNPARRLAPCRRLPWCRARHGPTSGVSRARRLAHGPAARAGGCHRPQPADGRRRRPPSSRVTVAARDDERHRACTPSRLPPLPHARMNKAGGGDPGRPRAGATLGDHARRPKNNPSPAPFR